MRPSAHPFEVSLATIVTSTTLLGIAQTLVVLYDPLLGWSRWVWLGLTWAGTVGAALVLFMPCRAVRWKLLAPAVLLFAAMIGRGVELLFSPERQVSGWRAVLRASQWVAIAVLIVTIWALIVIPHATDRQRRGR